jgi:hypothetical protein
MVALVGVVDMADGLLQAEGNGGEGGTGGGGNEGWERGGRE